MSSPFPTNNDISDGKNYSQAANSKITTPEEDARKEEKAKALIDNIVVERLRPIEAQLEALPSLIQKTVIDVITQIQNQSAQAQAQQPQQQATPQANNLEAIGALAQALGPIFNKGGGDSSNNELQSMIMNSFAKMIQAKVDETIMSTYQTPVHPPNWVTSRQQTTQRPKIEVE